jgi:hypothetical protein
MKTITIPAAQSALINTLVRVITGPRVPWDVVASAGDLIALEVRFDHWFLTVAKFRASDEQIETCLDFSGQATDNIELAWAKYEASPEHDVVELRAQIAEACQRFREIITIS